MPNVALLDIHWSQNCRIIEFVFRTLGTRFIDVSLCKNHPDKLFNETTITGFEGHPQSTARGWSTLESVRMSTHRRHIGCVRERLQRSKVSPGCNGMVSSFCELWLYSFIISRTNYFHKECEIEVIQLHMLHMLHIHPLKC